MLRQCTNTHDLTSFSGNDHYLFHSALFWFSIPLTFLLSLLPRYLIKAYRFNFAPTDVDIMRWIRKVDPSRVTREELLGELATLPVRRSTSLGGAYAHAHASSMPSLAERMRGSRTDMATGVRAVHRGFDFAQEEIGRAHV